MSSHSVAHPCTNLLNANANPNASIWSEHSLRQKLTCIQNSVNVPHQSYQYVTINLRLTDIPLSLTELIRGSCLLRQRGPLRLHMNEVNGKCFVKCSLSDSSIVLGHGPRWRWSLYQRYFPFCWLCVITCHPPTAGSLWEGWLHLPIIGWPVIRSTLSSSLITLVKFSLTAVKTPSLIWFTCPIFLNIVIFTVTVFKSVLYCCTAFSTHRVSIARFTFLLTSLHASVFWCECTICPRQLSCYDCSVGHFNSSCFGDTLSGTLCRIILLC